MSLVRRTYTLHKWMERVFGEWGKCRDRIPGMWVIWLGAWQVIYGGKEGNVIEHHRTASNRERKYEKVRAYFTVRMNYVTEQKRYNFNCNVDEPVTNPLHFGRWTGQISIVDVANFGRHQESAVLTEICVSSITDNNYHWLYSPMKQYKSVFVDRLS